MRGLLLMLLVISVRVPLGAQVVRQDPARTWPVDSVLARFEADIRAHVINSVGLDAVVGILQLPNSYAARKDSLLDGLERLALCSDDSDVASRAALWIAYAGEGGRAVPPVPGVWPRLMRIYRSNTAWLVRSLIMDRIPMLAERRPAAAFLRTIAAEPDTTGGMGPHGYFSPGDPRIEALARLAEMGEDGRAVLQAMYRSGETRSPQARIILEDMTRRGFPVRDLARMQQ